MHWKAVALSNPVAYLEPNEHTYYDLAEFAHLVIRIKEAIFYRDIRKCCAI
jgi:hypothetical protein